MIYISIREGTSRGPLLLVVMADRSLLMQGSVGHFFPIHAYISIMLTPIRRACLAGGRTAYDAFDVLICIDICLGTAYS